MPTVTAEPSVAEQFADRLERAREDRGLSHWGLSRVAGGSPSTALKLSRGDQVPSLTTVWRFARALAVPPTWLAFGGGEDVPEPQPVPAKYDDRAVREAFGRRVRFAREALGISQDVAAWLVGIDQSTFSLVERAQRGPRLTTVETLAEKFGVPVAWLMDPDQEVQPWRS